MNEQKHSGQNNKLMFILKIAAAAAAALSVGTAGIFMLNKENSEKPKNNQSLAQTSASNSEKADSKNNSANEISEITSSDKNNIVTYTLADIDNLQNIDYFASGTLEHIFNGTINKKGKATGYHYTMLSDSNGEIIDGTRSKADKNGVFTGKVKVNGISKNGFSSFYPESWSPQQVVDAINSAYNEALANPSNPSGSLWIGHYGDMEIDMYLDKSKKITTAYPVYEGD